MWDPDRPAGGARDGLVDHAAHDPQRQHPRRPDRGSEPGWGSARQRRSPPIWGKFLSSWAQPTDTGITNAPRGSAGRIHGEFMGARFKYVIRRGMSQIKSSYSWGGGNAAGSGAGG